jgi:hypothetical protein
MQFVTIKERRGGKVVTEEEKEAQGKHDRGTTVHAFRIGSFSGHGMFSIDITANRITSRFELHRRLSWA